MRDGFSSRPLRVDGAAQWREGGALSNLMQMRLRLEVFKWMFHVFSSDLESFSC